MARARSYPQVPFNPSQRLLATDPSRSQVVRVLSQELLDASIEDMKKSGDVVNSIDTLTEASRLRIRHLCVVGGGSVLDGDQAIYRVSDPGSGGIVMDNGNELMLLFVANTPADIVTPIDSVEDLPGLEGVEGQQISVGEYNEGTNVGNFKAKYRTDLARTNHDGVRYHSPARSLASEGLTTYLTATTDTDLGLWENKDASIGIPSEMAGAKFDGSTIDTVAINAAIVSLDNVDGGENHLPNRATVIDESIVIPENNFSTAIDIIGKGWSTSIKNQAPANNPTFKIGIGSDADPARRYCSIKR